MTGIARAPASTLAAIWRVASTADTWGVDVSVVELTAALGSLEARCTCGLVSVTRSDVRALEEPLDATLDSGARTGSGG